MTQKHFFLACVFLIGSAHLDVTVARDGGSLGGGPVCEASTVEVVTCKDGKEKCLLVGDNEVTDNLFLYDLPKPGEPIGKAQKLAIKHLIPNKKNKLSDIEAMAMLPGGEVVVFGSYSRNKRCERKKSRRVILHARIGKDRMLAGAVDTVIAKKKKKHSCDRLFGNDRNKVEANAKGICEAISRSERNANVVEDANGNTVPGCEADPAFNLEGAVTVPGTDGKPRVWVGLRAPLVSGMAPLLRLVKKRDEFRFTAAALIDLRGYGIRALTIEKGVVWGIGGPPADGGVKHTLWRFPAADLEPGAVIQPKQVRTLETSSEGITVVDGRAFIVFDGRERKGSSVCEKDSTYEVIKLP